MKLDHMRYLTNRPYRREVHALYRRIAVTAGISLLTVVHEDDGSCCEEEPWPLTSIRIMQALDDDGTRAALLVGR